MIAFISPSAYALGRVNRVGASQKEIELPDCDCLLLDFVVEG